MYSRKLTKRAFAALSIAALAGVVSLVSPRDLLSSQGVQLTSGEGRGDNPVVGSLPCRKTDDLDLKFFNWLGISRPPGAIQVHEPTLAFAGGPDLAYHILDAQGDPTGMVNASVNWTAFGSTNAMQVVTSRASAGKDYALAAWVPDRFVGGTVQTVSSLGTSSHVIQSRTLGVPVGALAAMPGPVASGTLTVTSLDGSESFTVQIDVIATLVTVDFQP